MGNTKIVQLLLERKPNLEAIDEEGETPLFKAIMNQNEQVVEQLIISGADFDSLGGPLSPCGSHWLRLEPFTQIRSRTL